MMDMGRKECFLVFSYAASTDVQGKGKVLIEVSKYTVQPHSQALAYM